MSMWGTSDKLIIKVFLNAILNATGGVLSDALACGNANFYAPTCFPTELFVFPSNNPILSISRLSNLCSDHFNASLFLKVSSGFIYSGNEDF